MGTVATLQPLLDLVPSERLQALLRARSTVTAAEPARPFLLAAIVAHLDRPVVAITARQEEAEALVRDIHAFLGPDGAESFPGWEVLPGEPLSPSVETMGRRLHVMARLQRGDRFVAVTTAQGATQLVAKPPGELDVVSLAPGATLDLDDISTRFIEMGYERNYIVERRGEFAIRGGILDIFPPSSERPVRAGSSGATRSHPCGNLLSHLNARSTRSKRSTSQRYGSFDPIPRRWRARRNCWRRSTTQTSLNSPKGSWKRVPSVCCL